MIKVCSDCKKKIHFYCSGPITACELPKTPKTKVDDRIPQVECNACLKKIGHIPAKCGCIYEQ